MLLSLADLVPEATIVIPTMVASGVRLPLGEKGNSRMWHFIMAMFDDSIVWGT